MLIGLYSSDMRSGKSTVASMLTERLFGMTQSFAETLYRAVIDIASPFLGSEHEVHAWLSDNRKDNAYIPGLGVTLRHMLQTMGTTWGRDCIHTDLWVMLAEKKAEKALKNSSVIFDDMRFPNEYAMVRRMGGRCVRIMRPSDKPRSRKSIGEGLLDGHDFDYTLYNVSTLTDLKAQVWRIADHLEHYPSPR